MYHLVSSQSDCDSPPFHTPIDPSYPPPSPPWKGTVWEGLRKRERMGGAGCSQDSPSLLDIYNLLASSYCKDCLMLGLLDQLTTKTPLIGRRNRYIELP